MIDYSILNPTKQIWLNLELYFESYEFYNFKEFFWNFSEFIWFYFRFLTFNLILKNAKKGGFNRACTRGNATWTGSAHVARMRRVALTWHLCAYNIVRRPPVYKGADN